MLGIISILASNCSEIVNYLMRALNSIQFILVFPKKSTLYFTRVNLRIICLVLLRMFCYDRNFMTYGYSF